MIRSASAGPMPGSLSSSAAEALLRLIGGFVEELKVSTGVLSEVLLRGSLPHAVVQKMKAKETTIELVRNLPVAVLCFMYANNTL